MRNKKVICLAMLILVIFGIVSHLDNNSNIYAIEVSNIGVSLIENGELCRGVLFSKQINQLKPGKIYQEEIMAQNSGEIEIYVRVIIYKYFKNQAGEKVIDISPQFIGVGVNEENWVIDGRATTEERIVCYYKYPIAPGEETTAVTTMLQISPEINNIYKLVNENKNSGISITTVPKCNDYKVQIEIKLDAVQSHNAQDAIKSAWGVDVNIDSQGTLSLK